jgi:hypothetical protein
MKYCCSVLILLFSFSTLRAQTQYQNNLVNLKLQPPTGWHLSGTEESKKNIKELKLTDEQLKDMSRSMNGVISQIGYSKYNLDSVSGVIPTIKITVRLNPAKNFDEFQEFTNAVVDKNSSVTNKFELIEKICTKVISDHKAIYYACRYSLTTNSSDEEFIIRVKMYSIPRGRYLINLAFIDNEITEDCSALYAEVLKSVVITD